MSYTSVTTVIVRLYRISGAGKHDLHELFGNGFQKQFYGLVHENVWISNWVQQDVWHNGETTVQSRSVKDVAKVQFTDCSLY